MYITWYNFSPTRSVMSGNCTPGSRSYSDLVNTWADSVSSISLYANLIQRLPV